MSKSRGNVVAPDDLVNAYGSDTVRVYLMFGWRWEMGGPWDSRGIEGSYRFLNRVWELLLFPVEGEVKPTAEKTETLQRKLHQTIKRATLDLKEFAFNTYIASLMEFSNLLSKVKPVLWGTEAWQRSGQNLHTALGSSRPPSGGRALVPFGRRRFGTRSTWPQWDEALVVEQQVEIVVRINGKIKERLVIAVNARRRRGERTSLSPGGNPGGAGGKNAAEDHLRSGSPLQHRSMNAESIGDNAYALSKLPCFFLRIKADLNGEFISKYTL